MTPAFEEDVGGVRGVKESMIAHILGKGGVGGCSNASKKARQIAKKMKGGNGKRERENSESDGEKDSDEEDQRPKKKLHTLVKKTFVQTELKPFRGINVPFTEDQEKAVCQQFLRATISANLPFRWVEDPEVIKLFLHFRATADQVMPSRGQISGGLLDAANTSVTEKWKTLLDGEYAMVASDGWKDKSRDGVSGVNLTVGGEVSRNSDSKEIHAYQYCRHI
jgi:hypothetical protein